MHKSQNLYQEPSGLQNLDFSLYASQNLLLPLFIILSTVTWNPNHSSLLHSQKVIDFLPAKPNNPSSFPFLIPKQGPILLAVLLSRISPPWTLGHCTFLVHFPLQSLPWYPSSLIISFYNPLLIYLTLSQLLLFFTYHW